MTRLTELSKLLMAHSQKYMLARKAPPSERSFYLVILVAVFCSKTFKENSMRLHLLPQRYYKLACVSEEAKSMSTTSDRLYKSFYCHCPLCLYGLYQESLFISYMLWEDGLNVGVHLEARVSIQSHFGQSKLKYFSV